MILQTMLETLIVPQVRQQNGPFTVFVKGLENAASINRCFLTRTWGANV